MSQERKLETGEGCSLTTLSRVVHRKCSSHSESRTSQFPPHESPPFLSISTLETELTEHVSPENKPPWVKEGLEHIRGFRNTVGAVFRINPDRSFPFHDLVHW